ncbi:predicted protein [Histoplasma capsulatum G186AR]|uniref:Uncharacterized protein n=1 Tax=Ajellomyces capsulatus (strain G186AR / H82 / ATCC MYA-2454 / RMSCC 2432) TaxID=447093 RepID=C0NBP3_AJECG|nr:uncharacterized protein HCBG_00539 [Histoplasma capsulatum G186AR]EEH11084.1 predicted protein [Histoplasma capsulatum G186AR]
MFTQFLNVPGTPATEGFKVLLRQCFSKSQTPDPTNQKMFQKFKTVGLQRCCDWQMLHTHATYHDSSTPPLRPSTCVLKLRETLGARLATIGLEPQRSALFGGLCANQQPSPGGSHVRC